MWPGGLLPKSLDNSSTANVRLIIEENQWPLTRGIPGEYRGNTGDITAGFTGLDVFETGNCSLSKRIGYLELTSFVTNGEQENTHVPSNTKGKARSSPLIKHH